MNYIKKFMDDNDIEVNEQFYVINDKGEKIKHSYYDERFMKFRFTENFKFISELSNLDCSYYFSCLMSGEYKIEKIPQKQKTVWDLKYGDDYWYINSFGHVRKTSYGLEDDFKRMIECGNAFLTEEEAYHELERRKCEAILLKYGTRDMINIGGINVRKYFIVYNNYHNVINISFNQCAQSQGTIYFKSAKLARKAIDEVGEERLKKYIFNVKE